MSQLCDLDFIASQIDMETMAFNYNTVVTDFLDRLSPPVETTRRKRKSDLWFDEDCRRTKGTVRKLEQRYKKTNQAHDRAAWTAALHGMHRNFRIKRSNFWTGRIASQKNDPRKLWSSIDTLLGDSRSTEKTEFSADDFMCFFDKIFADVRKDTDDASPPSYSSRASTTTLDSFQPLTAKTVMKLIELAPPKQCDLDPWPTWLLKYCAEDISLHLSSQN